MLQIPTPQNMLNVWIVVAGAFALAAAAVVARLRRRASIGDSQFVQGVSEEWLSNARSQRDESS